ncbi:hypothetical protein E2P81_ATG07625 [Venturia nashicola]|uniref:Uncharacterized protein n=1 Tax=Venturia nashicola TaxID=86259 RepID=A0A4Z1P2C5_9PEZI|nr:hypothetical protein E6O75_ATG07783 [Venturia nashicola]TLD32135.1 hypothetical protein E2P81_ATG07625 [Venturia nashicola]
MPLIGRKLLRRLQIGGNGKGQKGRKPALWEALPTELRLKIYKSLFVLDEKVDISHLGLKGIQTRPQRHYPCSSQLLRCSKQIYNDGITILYGQNCFAIKRNYPEPRGDEPPLCLFMDKIGPNATTCVKFLEIQDPHHSCIPRPVVPRFCNPTHHFCFTAILEFKGLETIHIVDQHLQLFPYGETTVKAGLYVRRTRTNNTEQLIYFAELRKLLKANGTAIDILVAKPRCYVCVAF